MCVSLSISPKLLVEKLEREGLVLVII